MQKNAEKCIKMQKNAEKNEKTITKNYFFKYILNIFYYIDR